jgi:radical SAM protein with 4Fe4S-binding SPASM domain
MRYFLSGQCVLRLLETPCLYHIKKDELYELDDEGLDFLLRSSVEGCEADQVGGDKEFVRFCLDEGILSTEPPGQSNRTVLRPQEAPSLRYLELQITRRCNLRCRHCFLGPPSNTELTPEEVERALDEFHSMHGLRVLITGGEPLLHREFEKINSMLPIYPVRKVLFTNGILLTDDLLDRLNVEEIQVSIDGLEGAHDSLRGKGTFRKALLSIEMALGKGFDVSVSTMVHGNNMGDFEKMEIMFKSMGIRDWTVDVPCFEGNLRKNSSFHLPPESAGKYLRYGFGNGLHGGGAGFACGLHLMTVMADGGCARCAFYSDRPTGHLREGLSSPWRRIRPVAISELECRCDEVETCRGGCRYRAALLGSERGRDLYRCVASGILK